MRVLIAGRVQGVGYRDWLIREARGLGVCGWVRNIGNTRVEATMQGDEGAVEALLRRCSAGPPHAAVTGMEVAEAEDREWNGFSRFPTVERSSE